MAVRLFQSQTSMFCEKVRVVFAMKKVPYDIVDVRKDDRKSLIEYTSNIWGLDKLYLVALVLYMLSLSPTLIELWTSEAS